LAKKRAEMEAVKAAKEAEIIANRAAKEAEKAAKQAAKEAAKQIAKGWQAKEDKLQGRAREKQKVRAAVLTKRR